MQIIGAIIALIVFLLSWILLPVICGVIGWVICWIYEAGRRVFFNHAAYNQTSDELAH